MAIQAKAYNLAYPSGKQVSKAIINYWHSSIANTDRKGIAFTTGIFSDYAIEDAKKFEIKLYDRTNMFELVTKVNPKLANKILFIKSITDLPLENCENCEYGKKNYKCPYCKTVSSESIKNQYKITLCYMKF